MTHRCIMVAGAILGSIIMCNVFAESPKQPREKLQNLADSGDTLGRNLLSAIQKGDQSSIRTNAQSLVAANHFDVVVDLLRDSSDVVKQEAASALARVKSKAVAAALLDSYAMLDVAVRGGDEAQLLRKETKTVYENALAQVTGVQINQEWDREQKHKTFQDAIRRMPE